jgi:hypothetical protein
MINNISWGSYWSALTVLLFIYYAYVLLRYYRKDIYSRVVASPSTQLRKEVENETSLPIIQTLTDEITAYLEQAGIAGAKKQEIVFALQQIALKHKSLKNSEYQSAINTLIQFECKEKCAIHLSEEEIGQVWMVR